MELERSGSRPVIERLEQARAQLTRVIAMMEQGSECESLVIELAAVVEAIAGAGYAMVATGLQQCLVTGGDADGDDYRRMEKLFLGFA